MVKATTHVPDVPITHHITEPDLITAHLTGYIKEMELHETGDGFYIKVKLTSRDDWLILTTRRDKSRPRIFKMAGKLFDYIRDNFPNQQEAKIVWDGEDNSANTEKNP